MDESEIIRKGLVAGRLIAKGTTQLTPGLGALLEGVRDLRKGNKRLGTWILAVLLTVSGRMGRLPLVGPSGLYSRWGSVNQGLSKVL